MRPGISRRRGPLNWLWMVISMSAGFYLPRQATRLRFDPSIYPCDFTCGPLQLTPVQGAASWRASRALAALSGTIHPVVQAMVPYRLAVADAQGPQGLAARHIRNLVDPDHHQPIGVVSLYRLVQGVCRARRCTNAGYGAGLREVCQPTGHQHHHAGVQHP